MSSLQPPNAIHQVYTPINSVASGGYFFNWSTLHLTELARAFGFHYSHLATNTQREGAFRSMCRLAMSLPHICRDRSQSFLVRFTLLTPSLTRHPPELLRRPVLALIAMILHPDRYHPDFEDANTSALLSPFDILRLEILSDHVRALEIVRTIMDRYQLTSDIVRSELDVGGVDWANPGGTTIDLSFLAS
jgi:hypothetical protein